MPLFWTNCYVLDQLRIRKRVYFTFTYSFSDSLPFFMEISQHCGGSLWLAPSGVFNRASGNSLATVEVFPICVLIPAGLCSWKLWLSVFTCISNLWGSSFPYVLAFLMNPRKVDFSVCLAFYLLLGQSGNFQAPCMQNWKPEVA